jgi:hypothetical protein
MLCHNLCFLFTNLEVLLQPDGHLLQTDLAIAVEVQCLEGLDEL